MEKIIIQSERLLIRPRTLKEMEDLYNKETNLEDKEAFGEMIETMKTCKDKEHWGCDWLISLKDNTPVGDIGFKGIADSNGNVEIGYAIDPIFRRKGYATEAVIAMVDWCRTQEDVKCVQAQTLEDNIISQKVLKNSGFIRNGFGEEGPLFEIKIK